MVIHAGGHVQPATLARTPTGKRDWSVSAQAGAGKGEPQLAWTDGASNAFTERGQNAKTRHLGLVRNDGARRSSFLDWSRLSHSDG